MKSPPAPSHLHFHDDFTVITFDLWDTILRRDCHPEEVKLSSCLLMQDLLGNDISPEFNNHLSILRERNAVESEIARENYERGFDDEYEIRDVLSRLAVRICRRDMLSSELSQITETLVQHERDTEVMVTRLDPILAAILESTQGKRRIIISDFYMPSSDLRFILAQKGIVSHFEAIVSSCDALLNKKSGRLFDHVHDHFSIRKPEWIHIGDNAHSDVGVPNRLGIRAKRHFVVSEELRRKQFTNSFSSRPFSDLQVKKGIDLARSVARPLGESRLEQDGARLGAMFGAWAIEIVSMACKLKSKLVFCTGPGAKLQKDLLDLASPWLTAARQVNAVAIPLSGEALNFVRRSELSASDFSSAWYNEGKRTPRELLNSLGINGQLFANLLANHALDLDRPVSDLQAPAFTNFLDDPRLQAQVQELQLEQESILQRYLEGYGFPGGGAALIADLGGRQGLAAKISGTFPSIAIRSFQLFKFEDQPSLSAGEFLISGTDLSCRPSANLIDFLFSSHGEEVSSLHSASDSEGVFPMYRPSSLAVDSCVPREVFQTGIRSGFAEVFPLLVKRALPSVELRCFSAGSLSALVKEPSPELTQLWLDSKQTRSFNGSGRTDSTSVQERLKRSGWFFEG